MTPDQLYEQGYLDGAQGKAANANYIFDQYYNSGYEDGKGDRAFNRAVDPAHRWAAPAPNGFEYTGEQRVPKPFEWYLSKAGNPTFLKRERRNDQKRHILKPTTCVCGVEKKCGLHNG